MDSDGAIEPGRPLANLKTDLPWRDLPPGSGPHRPEAGADGEPLSGRLGCHSSVTVRGGCHGDDVPRTQAGEPGRPGKSGRPGGRRVLRDSLSYDVRVTARRCRRAGPRPPRLAGHGHARSARGSVESRLSGLVGF